ncbi:OB-fold-containig protein [Novosphingobium gossypii]|uniref:OB-fold-containig protein n=1 Tax=Novosphingobium gossypii TaxID=1604774 RepID=UPI003D250584
MFAQLLTPPYIPFTFSFLIMVGIGLIEVVGLGLGHLDLDGDGPPDAGDSVLAWLGLGGELPVLIWLTSLLGCFTVTGLAAQQTMTALSGAPLHPGPAAAAALLIGTVLNTSAANGLARVMPRFESTVVSTDDLLRRRGTVLEGTARRGFPARAKVIDHHGQAHFVMLEPHEDDDTIGTGESALLVRREGKLFFAMADRPTSLNPI